MIKKNNDKIVTKQQVKQCVLHSLAKLCVVFCFILIFSSCNNDNGEQRQIDKQIDELLAINNLTEFESDKGAITFYKNQLKLYNAKDADNANALRATIKYRLGALAYEAGDLSVAKENLLVAEKLLEPYSDYDKVKILVYLNLAYLYLESERNTAISNYYNNKSVALVLADSVANEIAPISKVRALTNSSETTAIYHKYHKVIEQNLIALNYVDDIENSQTKNLLAFKIYHELSKAHRRLDNPNVDSLKFFINQSKQYVENSYLNSFHQEMIGFYYVKKKEPKEAIPYFTSVYEYDKELLRIKKKPFYYDYANLLDAQINLGNVYLDLDNLSKASFFLEDAKKNFKSRNDFDDDIKRMFYKFATRYYAQTKNFGEYKRHNDSLVLLKRKNIQDTNEKSFDEISTLYDIQKKEKQISNLSSEIENKKSRLIFSRLFLLILGLLTLLTVASVRSLYFKRQDQAIQQDKQTVQLQQQLLKTQMEPHFIFNTLNTLKGLIKLNRKQESLNYLNDFSVLLRNLLEQSREDFIYLGEEIHTLDSFCKLQLARYNYQFDYQISVSSNLNKYATLIPPFLIQPFVENAILHAFRGTKERPSLAVEFERLNNNDLTVLIFDNGVDEESSLSNHKPLAGTISRERFELLTKQFKTQAGFEITSNPNFGTSIKIIIPYKLVEELD